MYRVAAEVEWGGEDHIMRVHVSHQLQSVSVLGARVSHQLLPPTCRQALLGKRGRKRLAL